jgi:elongation factor Ts
MGVSNSLIKDLRERTGCGIMDCKNALDANECDLEKAIEYLRKKGLADASKKVGRGTNAGRIISYIHAGGQIGVMLELNCETDFVANTDKFQELGKELCMHICAMSPVACKREDIPADIIAREKEIYLEQIKDKPAAAQEKIVQGKLDKFFKDNVLLEQMFVKDDKRTVEEIIKENIGTIKENISVARFARFQIGEKN